MITLPIKREWFQMICSGEKLEEYRAFTPRYTAMFQNASERTDDEGRFWVRLRNGYRLDSPSVLALVSHHIGPGRLEWGAAENTNYYVLVIHELAQDFLAVRQRLDEMVKANIIECAPAPDCCPNIKEAAQAIGVGFGPQMEEYLKRYGYLAHESVELYGLTAQNGLQSDMVHQSIYLHQWFPKTASYIAIRNIGDGVYALADKRDNVFHYYTETGSLLPFNKRLLGYILQSLVLNIPF